MERDPFQLPSAYGRWPSVYAVNIPEPFIILLSVISIPTQQPLHIHTSSAGCVGSQTEHITTRLWRFGAAAKVGVACTRLDCATNTTREKPHTSNMSSMKVLARA